MFLIILIAISLCIDTFSVSAIIGSLTKKTKLDEVIRLALIFGLCQGGAILVGSIIGIGLKQIISNIDHWVAFFLLLFIGIRIILEKDTEFKNSEKNFTCTFNFFILGLGTSIDALIIGITLAFVKGNILVDWLIVGLTTFIFAIAGYFTGNIFSNLPKKLLKLIGGLGLILIGVKILLEHLIRG